MNRLAYTLPVVDDDIVLVSSREITFDQDAKPEDVAVGGYIVRPDWPDNFEHWRTASGRVFRKHEVTLEPNPAGQLLTWLAHLIVVWERIE